MTRTIRNSPQYYARIAGALYLFIILAGMYGEIYVRGNLIVSSNPAATVEKITASGFLFRTGIVGDLFMHLCDLPLTLILYLLLEPVSKSLSLLTALFSLLQTSILCANKLNLIAVLLLLETAAASKAFNPAQLQVLTSIHLQLHEYGFAVGLLFFGVSCLVAGYLIYQSTYLPKALGVLQALAGACYLINSLALLLNPELAARLFPAIALPSFLGELATALWLLIKGVNPAKWAQQVQL